MRIDIDKNLKLLAEAMGVNENKASKRIAREAMECGMIEDDSDIYGEQFRNSYAREIAVNELVEMLQRLGIESVKSKHIDALLECIVMGDGDCPYCGGELRVVDGAYRGDNPYDSVPVWEKIECSHCDYSYYND